MLSFEDFLAIELSVSYNFKDHFYILWTHLQPLVLFWLKWTRSHLHQKKKLPHFQCWLVRCKLKQNQDIGTCVFCNRWLITHYPIQHDSTATSCFPRSAHLPRWREVGVDSERLIHVDQRISSSSALSINVPCIRQIHMTQQGEQYRSDCNIDHTTAESKFPSKEGICSRRAWVYLSQSRSVSRHC